MEISVASLETPTLTKAQLAELLFEQIGLNKRESKDMVDAFFDLIAQRLIDVVTRAISGHATESMQRRYSTARDHEVAATLAALLRKATKTPLLTTSIPSSFRLPTWRSSRVFRAAER